MSTGLEYQQKIIEALTAFEKAVVKREKRIVGSKVPLQEDVDAARNKLLKVVVDIVKQERAAK